MKYQIKNFPIKKVIDCMSGNSGLTEEFIYSKSNIQGKKYTVLSSSTDNTTSMGEIPFCSINGKPIKVFENKEGLLVARNGKAGAITYLPPGCYTINDHAYIVSLKKSCPYSVNLKWLAYRYSSLFKLYSSNSDNGTWNKTGFMKNALIDIPTEDTQLKLANIYDQILCYLEKLQTIKTRINNLLSCEIIKEYNSYLYTNKPISEMFNCMSGNSGLTEECIYSKLQVSGKKYTVLSGATTQESSLGEIPMCIINGKKLKVFEQDEGILVTRKGKAGEIRYINNIKKNHTINDDAYIIYVKDSYKGLINLKWFIIQYKKLFKEYASSSDNGTWNKTGFFNYAVIDIPTHNEQIELIKKYEEVEQLQSKILRIEYEIKELAKREIFYDD